MTTLGPIPLRVQWWCVVLCCALLLSPHTYARSPLRVPLTPSHSIVFNGISATDLAGSSVSGVGDVNGDDMDDFVIGAYLAHNNTGQVYLLFGRHSRADWKRNPFALDALDGTNGVALNGAHPLDLVGISVAGVQDVNGDGLDDMLIGTANDVAYVVFGHKGAWPASLTLARGAFKGVTIAGTLGDGTGSSVASAGDVNNDGRPDMVIGAPHALSPTASGGRALVLYGRPGSSPWPPVLSLATHLSPTTGFSLWGQSVAQGCGSVVSGLGDVNGDGVDDVACGCPSAAFGGNNTRVAALVAFGSSALPSSITQGQLNGTNGFLVRDALHVETVASAIVAGVGDVNADGLHDFALADPAASRSQGRVFVLFGRNATGGAPWPAHISVTSINGSNGFTLMGSQDFASLGQSVSPAGDVNADGVHDVAVGASAAGLALVVYGREEWPATVKANALQYGEAMVFQGSGYVSGCGTSVSLVGHVSGSAQQDMAIGCPLAGTGGQTALVWAAPAPHRPITTGVLVAIIAGSVCAVAIVALVIGMCVRARNRRHDVERTRLIQ